MNIPVTESFQRLLENREFVFQFINMFPILIEIFDADGTSVFWNRAGLEWANIQDADLMLNKYNVLRDPVCNDEMGLREDLQRAFRGEAFVIHDVSVPIQDLVNRGVIEEKPFEKAVTDWHFYPIMDGPRVAFVVFVCVPKKVYLGKPEAVKIKEYIDNIQQRKFDPQAAAKALHMGESKLYSLFKQHTGMTPGEYHQKCRVERLKEKLADNSLSVKEAFAACGEDNKGRIAKVFKKLTGSSPAKFRKIR